MALFRLFQASILIVALWTKVATAGKANFLGYNVRLSHQYLQTDWTDRRDAIIEELRTSRADVICLQEVWFVSDMVEIVSALKDIYPFSFSDPLIQPSLIGNTLSDGPICSLEELASFAEECEIERQTNCSSLPDFYAQELCRLKACINAALIIDIRCRYCAALVGQGNLAQNCLSPNTSDAINLYGMLVLSKKKILNGTLIKFEDDVDEQDKLEARGMLEMEIRGIPGKVVCTLNTEENLLFQEFLEPNLPYKTFAQRNLGQIQEMLTYYVAEPNLIVIGSFGTGPKYKRKVEAEFLKSYKAIKDAVPSLQRSRVKKFTHEALNPALNSTRFTAVDHIVVRGHKLKKSGVVWYNSSLSNHAAVRASIRLVKR